MAFRLDDIIIDRIQYAVARDFDLNPLYTLTQLSEATINISAESKDAKDATGTLIKKFYNSKQGEFTAKNALLNLNVVGAASGSGKIHASASNPLNMPAIKKVKAGETITIKDYVDGTVKVNALSTNGTMGTAYIKGATASATEFGLTTQGVLTPPTDTNEILYLVTYTRKTTNGAVIRNKADEFPGTVNLLIKALCVDPCSADTLRACYIELPSFQVSPEVSLTLSTDGGIDYKGSLQVDYCSENKSLYNIYICPDDEE